MFESHTSAPRPFSIFALPEAWSGGALSPRHYLPVLGMFVMLLCSASVWAQGVFVLYVGVALWRKPPRQVISRQIDAFSLCAIGVVLLSFLPLFVYRLPKLRWLGQGRWRSEIAELDVGGFWSSYTPQPLLTFEQLTLLVATLSAIALLVYLPLHNAQRWRYALLVASGLGLLGVLGTLGSWSPEGGEPLVPALAWAHFPNFGTAMAVGSMLSFALLLAALRQRWLGGCALLSICLAGNAAGLLTSGTGLWLWTLTAAMLWVAILAVRSRKIHGLIKTIAVLLFIVCAMLTVFATIEGTAWLLNDESTHERNPRYYDSAAIVLQQSAFGVGLGNFPYILPFYQNRSLSQGEILSPGNDWLWIAAETGMIGLAITALVGCSLLIALSGRSSRQSAPIRLAGFCALLLFAVGSIRETPMHDTGTLLLAILCFHIGRARSEERRRSFYPSWLWKTQGAILTLVGIVWIGASLFNLPLQSRISTAKGRQAIERAIAEDNLAAAEAATAYSLRFTPLDARSYLDRGRAKLTQSPSAAREDMIIASMLRPKQSQIAYDQGVAWLPHSTIEAERAFAEAIRRHSPEPEAMYAAIVSEGMKFPYFSNALARLSETNSKIRFAYLNDVATAQFTATLATELAADGELRRFTEAQRRQLLERWIREGNTRAAVRYLERNPEAVKSAWFLHALALANLGEHKEASERFNASLPRAQIPNFLQQDTSLAGEMPIAGFDLLRPAVAEAMREDGGTALNPLQAAKLLQQQLERADWQGALRTTENLIANEGSAPAYAFYWNAWLHHQAGNYKAACPHWETYARHYIQRRQDAAAEQLRKEKRDHIETSAAFERWGTISRTGE